MKRQQTATQRYTDVLSGSMLLELRERNELKRSHSPGANEPSTEPEAEEEEVIPDGGLCGVLARSGVAARSFFESVRVVKSSGGGGLKIRFSALADALRSMNATNDECQAVWAALDTASSGLIAVEVLERALGLVNAKPKPELKLKPFKPVFQQRVVEEERNAGVDSKEEISVRTASISGENKARVVDGPGARAVEDASSTAVVPLSPSEMSALQKLSKDELVARLAAYMEEEKARDRDADRIATFISRLEDATRLVQQLKKENTNAKRKVKELTVKLERKGGGA